MQSIRVVLGGLILVSAVLVAPPPAAARAQAMPDPARPGPYTVDIIDYDAGFTTLRDPNGITIAQDLKGVIHLPERAPGRRPVVIFLHGRHSTCRYADSVEYLGWPCPEAQPVTSEIPSYRGYDYVASNLASHGYVVVSVSANAVNSYDLALLLSDRGMEMRAELVAQTLDLLSEWNLHEGPREVERRLIGRLDLGRIGLMGHSRGGEGVARFVMFNRDRTDGPIYKGVRAVFALAPTNFYDQKVPGVHFGTLLPLCDGDVDDLQGARMYEDARYLKPERFARMQFTVQGANHNFFNTLWTSDDGRYAGDGDGTNPACERDGAASIRITAEEQRAVGLDLMAAFFRRYVGGERVFERLMRGAVPLPRSACPEDATSCENLVGTSYVAPRAKRQILLLPDGKEGYRTRGFQSARECRPSRSGTGCPTSPNRSPTRQLSLEWDRRATLRIPFEDPADIRRFDALTFRVAVNFSRSLNRGIKEQQINVVLIDRAGRRAEVPASRYSNALRPPAGPTHQQITLNGVRIPLDAFSRADRAAISALELRFGGRTKRGSIQLADVMLQGG